MVALNIQQYSSVAAIPEALLYCDSHALHEHLPGPTLMLVAGSIAAPLFVSVLLHGNETTGLIALQTLLRHYRNSPLPRSLLILFGNIRAAGHGLRRCADQPDYNRIWAGGDSPEQRMATQVLDRVRQLNPVAAIDIHNNTGKNPHYACINRLEPAFLNLAKRFGKVIVYFTEPHEVISYNLAEICPAITIECGKIGDANGCQHAVELLHSVLDDAEGLHDALDIQATEVYHTVARIRLPDSATADVGGARKDVDFHFPEDFDALNFHPLAAGSEIAYRHNPQMQLLIENDAGEDVSDVYLKYRDGHIVTCRPFVPSMFTCDVQVIYQDCLGYIMEPYPLEAVLAV